MKLSQIKPVGPHVEGVIRFASEGQGEEMRQLDYFDVCARVHQAPQEGALPPLMPHPITETLLPKGEEGEQKKIRVIPIRLIADKPANSLKARYEAYDTELGRLLCVGDGENGERAVLSQGTSVSCQCKGPEACDYANEQGVQCSLRVRMRVQIEGQDDPFSVFELHSGGINTYRTLSAKLEMMHEAFGGNLRGLPLELGIYAKSSAASAYQPFYVADLRVRSKMNPADALAAMKKQREAESQAGLSLDRMEAAIESMDANSALSLGDCEPSVITYSPVVVDRTKLRREGDSADQGLNAPFVSQDIAQLVSRVIQTNSLEPSVSADAATDNSIFSLEDAPEHRIKRAHQIPIQRDMSKAQETVEPVSSPQAPSTVVHDGGFDAVAANMASTAPFSNNSKEAPAFAL